MSATNRLIGRPVNMRLLMIPDVRLAHCLQSIIRLASQQTRWLLMIRDVGPAECLQLIIWSASQQTRMLDLHSLRNESLGQ